MFAKHGRFGRAGATRGTLYDEVLHIPLIIKTPKSNKGIVINNLVQTIDIMPTVLDILNTPYDKNKIQGKNLITLMTENKELAGST